MKLTILDGAAVNPGDLSWDPFKEYADVTVYDNTPQELVQERIGNSDAVFLNKIKIDSKVLENCSNLKYIGVLATGYNVIDAEAVKKKRITVTNIPAYSTMAVAQHVFAFILHFTNSVAIHNQAVNEGEWIKSPNFCFWKNTLIELDGKSIGIFGYGNIGRQVAKIAAAYGMKALVHPHKMESLRNNDEVIPVSIEDLFKSSDFITLHAPLTEDTKEIVNARTLSLCKKEAYLINTARGALVNEKDVKLALDKNMIAGYAADVLVEEPMLKNCPLYNQKNAILTPHIAWAALETRSRLIEIALENFKSFINGTNKNRVY